MNQPDELQISLGRANQRSSVEERPTPAEDPSVYVAECGHAGRPVREMFVHVAVLRGVDEHAQSSPSREVGGMLLGGVYRARGVDYVRIDAFIRANGADEQRGSIKFTHETWKQLNAEREARHPDLRIVGWYHTHPGFGVFLSDKDRFIHRSFFSDPAMVALVVDPVTHKMAFFQWHRDTLTLAPGFYIFGDRFQSELIDGAARIQRPALHDPADARASQPVQAAKVCVVFPEPAVNLYYLLPRPLRNVLGVVDSQTAPRIGVKSLIILVLLGVIGYQLLAARTQLPGRHTSGPSTHMIFAKMFAEAKDYEESVREWLRYLALRPDDVDAHIELYRAILQKTGPGRDRSEAEAQAQRMRRLANRLANQGDYARAYRLYQTLEASQFDYVEDDHHFADVLGYLANQRPHKPTPESVVKVRAHIPQISDALQKQSDRERRVRQQRDKTKEKRRWRGL